MGSAVIYATALVAAYESTLADPVAILINYGAIGLMLGMFVLGRLHSDRELNDLKEQNAKLTDALTHLQGSLTTTTLPALTRSAQVLEALPSREQALLLELQQTVARLEGLIAGGNERA